MEPVMLRCRGEMAFSRSRPKLLYAPPRNGYQMGFVASVVSHMM